MPEHQPHILLGVTGSIAAYKSPLLVREFVKRGIDVRIAMTRSAAAFVTPLALATVSRNPVATETLPTNTNNSHAGTWHIDLALWADIFLIAPATAHTIAKLVHGEADNPVAMLALASRAPLVIAPAMDEDMLLNTATRDNLTALQSRGAHIISSTRGELASGLSGDGRLADIETIVADVLSLLTKRKSLNGVRVLVTAGPTFEPIDPVRYIGNRSSGKMGFALAEEAKLRGASVTLISGPANLLCSPAITRINVETAEEMFNAVTQQSAQSDVILMAAAVADYTPERPAPAKLKKKTASLSLRLTPTHDILASLAATKGNRIHVGFALETDNEIEHAKEKLTRKKLDLIVLNSATQAGAGFNVDTNIVTIINAAGNARDYPLMTKRECARVIFDAVAELRL